MRVYTAGLEQALDRTWTKWHAPLMLAAAALALGLRAVWPVVVVCSASLGMLIRRRRGHYTPAGNFGSANAVTLVRLGMTAGLALFGLRAPDPSAALLVASVFVLDGVDGWLARRRGLASDFGALLDTECDALLVLVCGLILYLRGRLPAFILLPGALRYAYLIAIGLLPSGGRAQPRSLVARYGCAVMIASFIASLWPIEPWHRWFAPAATLLIVYSFGGSLYWSLQAESKTS